MGRRTVDKTKLIGNKNQRNVAFCKRRRGILKKAIEISRMCQQQVFLFIYDPQKDKAVQFANDASFTLKNVYQIMNRLKKSDEPENLEAYTNEDYQKLELKDFRHLRRNNKPVHAGAENLMDEVISDLEDDKDIDFLTQRTFGGDDDQKDRIESQGESTNKGQESEAKNNVKSCEALPAEDSDGKKAPEILKRDSNLRLSTNFLGEKR